MRFKCPACGSEISLSIIADKAVCRNCEAAYSAQDGIIDFVAGQEDTALDVAHYHDEKHVSPEASRRLIRQLREAEGELLPNAIGDIFEVGAGTGLLTGGLLAESEFRSAVITDISKNMLRFCKQTVQETAGNLTNVTFATYSGLENILPNCAFDLCIGNSVVHHILDYRGFLRTMRNCLRKGGAAVFVEPGASFHDSLTLAMADALLSPTLHIAHGQWRGVKDWVAETRSRLMFPETGMESREDKHIFWRNDIEAAGRDAGFEQISLVPSGYDALGIGAVSTYLRELGVAVERVEEFMPIYVGCAKYHFRNLPTADGGSMYIIGFRC